MPNRHSSGDAFQEEWRRVPSFGDYIVSNRGRIRHKRVNAPILRGSFDADGYHRVCLNGCTLRVHSIVAEAFHGPRPEGLECAHLDGDKRNNAAANLAWVSHKENNDHKKLHGSRNGGSPGRGEDHFNAKLTSEQVGGIRASVGISTRKLAAEYGVNQSQIVRIRKGDRWK